MSSLQVGSRRSAQPAHHGPTPLIYGVLLAIVVMAAVAYFVAAMGGTQYGPPSTTGAPATYAPGLPAPVPTLAPTAAPPHYP